MSVATAQTLNGMLAQIQRAVAASEASAEHARLMANAVRHTPETTRITLRVGTTGNDAVLEVADEGPGMEPADAQRVFERFYLADPS